MVVQNAKVLVGLEKNWTYFKIWRGIIYELVKRYPNPILLTKILFRINKMHNNSGVNKIVQVADRFYLSPNFQSIPSKQFYNFVFQQANKALGKEVSRSELLSLAILSITKKCPLNCEHCCESAILNQKEVLTEDDLHTIIKKLKGAGVSTFIFGGGEPMVRIKTLVKLIEKAKNYSDFWVMTSGFNVTRENALKLKAAGLTGINVSLDHFEKVIHNKFRRNVNAFDWAMKAIDNSHDAGLTTALTICVTRDFCSRENLMKYMNLAMEKNVPFVQILEPSAVGNYEGKDVLLLPENIQVLNDFYLDMKNNKAYRGFPIVLYHAYENRRVGCTSSGLGNLYVDTDGIVHNCPMCRKTSGNILTEEISEIIRKSKQVGCSKFTEYIC